MFDHLCFSTVPIKQLTRYLHGKYWKSMNEYRSRLDIDSPVSSTTYTQPQWLSILNGSVCISYLLHTNCPACDQSTWRELSLFRFRLPGLCQFDDQLFEAVWLALLILFGLHMQFDCHYRVCKDCFPNHLYWIWIDYVRRWCDGGVWACWSTFYLEEKINS